MKPEDVIAAEAAGRDLAASLVAIGNAHMPFGRFGPRAYPPRGVPIIDLPFEYLAWFEQRGWPRGRLGELLALVYHSKLSGVDAIFDVFREQRGGRTQLSLGVTLPRLSPQDGLSSQDGLPRDESQ
ncbi:MAG TPA: DUF3820 family protein [Planctomycetota bacterium]|nr:DUF3820 family protein [Planctomycetota bacterium]